MKAPALFIVAISLMVTLVIAQWPQNNGQQQPFPNFPQQPSFNDLCSRPGANCVQQVCDSKGNCHTTQSGSSSVTSTYVSVLMAFGVLAAFVSRQV